MCKVQAPLVWIFYLEFYIYVLILFFYFNYRLAKSYISYNFIRDYFPINSRIQFPILIRFLAYIFESLHFNL